MSGDLTDSDKEQLFKAITSMPTISTNMQLFLEQAQPDVAEKFIAFLDSLNKPYFLDYKYKVLLRTIVCMILDHEFGVQSWGRVALNEGWSREQIIEAMYSVIPQVGCIPVIRMIKHIPEDNG